MKTEYNTIDSAMLSGLSDVFAEWDSRAEYEQQRLGQFRESFKVLPQVVSDAHDEFEKFTTLTAKDQSFLIWCACMQALRIVVMERFKQRLSDKDAAKATFGHVEEHSDRGSARYYASAETIKNNPVPFDCILKEEVVQRYDNPRLSGFNHRFKALGHDPYLGWIIGVANIMTNTITITEGCFELKSYHVHSGVRYIREKPQIIDKMCARANTGLIFEKLYKRFKDDPEEAWTAYAHALVKEWVHLHSDIRTAKSLPIPIVSLASPNVSRVLQSCGIDYMNVKCFEKEAFLSVLINEGVKFAHLLSYNEKEDGDKELYKARGLKLVMLANELVTVSDIIVNLFRMYLGDASVTCRFDFGGAMVTLWHVFNDPIKIAEIKQDYVLTKSIEYINKQK